MMRQLFPRTMEGMSTEGPWLSEDQQRVWRSWVMVNAQLPAMLNRELQSGSGLSLPDFDVLVELTDAREGRVRVSDLARDLAWERSRVSHHVTRMERRGLVSREECPSDGRGAFVVLTAEGRSAIEKAAPAHVSTVRRLLFDGLDDAEVAALEVVLEKMLGALGADRSRLPETA
ncbi:MAG: slyA [Marmoricola sp.]|nr:slyA [Marmoricola sp.]